MLIFLALLVVSQKIFMYTISVKAGGKRPTRDSDPEVLVSLSGQKSVSQSGQPVLAKIHFQSIFKGFHGSTDRGKMNTEELSISYVD
jgi:hypothetical protein